VSLTVGSTFTGVGGADLGFEWAGMTVKWQCEIDSWKRQVLAAHWPDVPIYDDITTLENPEPVDVLVGGFPCQDLSVAGKRKGFDGERSVLAFEFLRVAESLKPRWLVLENVPGLLSSNGGRDFARLIDEVVACGYGVAWRCLDARYFAVPQRRRRIFIVARRVEAGVDPRTASGLALRALCESGSGDTTPCIPPWQEAPATVGGRADEGRIVGALSAQVYTQYTDQEFVRAGQLVTDHDFSIGFGHTQGIDIQPGDTAPTLRVGGGGAACFRKSKRAQTDKDDELWVESDSTNTLNRFDVGDVRTTHAVVDTASTLQGSGASLRGQRIDAEGAAGGHLIPEDTVVRRLTPTECEALMGWQRNHTAPEGVKAPDSRRYAACGDGIVANVAYWIGQRIVQIDKETA